MTLAGTACEPKVYDWTGEVIATQHEADDPRVSINVNTVYTLPRNKPYTVGQNVHVFERIAESTPCEPPETHLLSIMKTGDQEGPATVSITDPNTDAETITANLATTDPTPIETTVTTNCGATSNASSERWGAVLFSFPNPGPGKRTTGGVELRSGDIDGPVIVTWDLTSYSPK